MDDTTFPMFVDDDGNPREPKFGEKGFGKGKPRKRRSDAGKPRLPRVENPTPDKSPRQVGTRQGSLAKRLSEAFTTLGIMVAALNAADGEAIINGADGLATSLDRLAKQNPKVRQALERALEGTAWSGVIMATGAILVPIAANHGMLPSGLSKLADSGVGADAPSDPADVPAPPLTMI